MTPSKPLRTPLSSRPLYLTQAAVIAAAYIVLTLPFAQVSFGQIQFRLAEALTVLAALTPAAIPGLFIGCLLTNTFFNPSPLGLVDILFGSLATLVAASLTWAIARKYLYKGGQDTRWPSIETVNRTAMFFRVAVTLFPAVAVNALVVGSYLPFLLLDGVVTFTVVIGFIGWIAASEAIVVYLVGWPLLLGLKRTRIIRIP